MSQVLLVAHSGGLGLILVVRGEIEALASTTLAVTSMTNSVESYCLEKAEGARTTPEAWGQTRAEGGKEQKTGH